MAEIGQLNKKYIELFKGFQDYDKVKSINVERGIQYEFETKHGDCKRSGGMCKLISA